MARSQLDHIVITAPSLAVGAEYVSQTLGVTPQIGGEHPRMGTHNCFVKLGEKIYEALIALDRHEAIDAFELALQTRCVIETMVLATFSGNGFKDDGDHGFTHCACGADAILRNVRSSRRRKRSR